MANMSQQALLSAAWILMRRGKIADSVSGAGANAENTSVTPKQKTTLSAVSDQHNVQLHGEDANAREAVTNLISAYLRTPTHITSHFHCW